MINGRLTTLSDIAPNSIEWMRQHRNDPELRKYFREWKDISCSQQELWYNSRGNNSDQNHVYFEIRATKNHGNILRGDLIGCCNLSYINWQTVRSAEFGVFLSKESRGHGFGYDALKTMFNYGFATMNLNKIWGEVYDNNTSLRLYKNMGFVDDGIARATYFDKGEYGNSNMISMLQSEWFEKYGKNI